MPLSGFPLFLFFPAGLKFAEVLVSEETKPQLAALGVAKTPALLALKGTDLSQRTLYEGGWLWGEGADAQGGAAVDACGGGGQPSRTSDVRSIDPNSPRLKRPPGSAPGEMKAPRILDWLKQLAQGIDASGRQEAVGDGPEPAAAADKKGDSGKKKGDKKEGGSGKKEGGKKEQSVPAEIPQVRSPERCPVR